MTGDKIRIVPEVRTTLDERNAKLIIHAAIPGVKKEAINVIITEMNFHISACKGKIRFEASLPFCRRVSPQEARASYEAGHLTIEIPLKEDARSVVPVE